MYCAMRNVQQSRRRGVFLPVCKCGCPDSASVTLVDWLLSSGFWFGADGRRSGPRPGLGVG